MIKFCIPCGILIIWFNLLTFYFCFTRACTSDVSAPATNITYPTVVSRNDNDKCFSHREQTTSRANTLSDDADDLQKQLENEARDRMKMGHPKTIWVFHLPRNSETESKVLTKRDSVQSQENKMEKNDFHQHTTNEPNLLPDYNIIEPTTADLDPLMIPNQNKKYNPKEQNHKELLNNNFKYSTLNTKIGGLNTISTNAEDFEKFTHKENKLEKPNIISIQDTENIHKLDKLVEKARILSNAMPLTEGFNPDCDSNCCKKKLKKLKKIIKTEKKLEKKVEAEPVKKQPHWSYRSQGNWSQSFPECSGLRQSPISIPVQLLINTKGARDLCFDNFDVLPNALSVCIGECRLSLVGQWELKNWPTIYGGAGHSRRYKFHSMSAMWPSEHKIEGMLYPMETQFTFIGVEYASIDDALTSAMKDPQSLLTITTLYKFGKTPHMGAADLLKTAMSCKKCKCVSQPLKPLGYFCPPFKKYATYYGSLTTPPCTEAVLWLIRAKALNITWAMYQTLLSVSTPGAFFTRETQPLNDRKLFFFD